MGEKQKRIKEKNKKISFYQKLVRSRKVTSRRGMAESIPALRRCAAGIWLCGWLVTVKFTDLLLPLWAIMGTGNPTSLQTGSFFNLLHACLVDHCSGTSCRKERAFLCAEKRRFRSLMTCIVAARRLVEGRSDSLSVYLIN